MTLKNLEKDGTIGRGIQMRSSINLKHTQMKKIIIILFGMLLGSMSSTAQKLSFGLTGDYYYRNSQPMDWKVNISIYDWRYVVIDAFPVNDTVFYTSIIEYRAGRDSTLNHIIFPSGSPIDSMSLGWHSNGYIRYKDGDVYEFPQLVYRRK